MPEIYIIKCTSPQGQVSVSNEAYSTLEQAQAFVLNRVGLTETEQIGYYKLRGLSGYEYEINSVRVKE